MAAIPNLLKLLAVVVMPMGSGNDLLDFLTVQEYWGARGVTVSVESMADQLQSGGAAADISVWIRQLGDSKFAVREAATRKIRDAGPAVADQLKAAAKSSDAEISIRATALLKALGKSARASAASRLMAIRALGTLKDKAALPTLKKQLKSTKLFEAEYAARAIAMIEGKPWKQTRPPLKQLNEDVAMLPANCGVVGQLHMRIDRPYRLQDAFKGNDLAMMAQIFGGGGNLQEVQKSLTKELIRVVDTLGNIRIDSVTLGLAEKVGPKDGFAVFIVRGQYDRAALLAAIENQFPDVQTRVAGDVTVLKDGKGAEFSLVSDQLMVIATGPRGNTMTIEKLQELKKKSATLTSNAAMMKLISGVNRDCELWSVFNVVKGGYELDGPFATFRTARMVVAKQGKGLVGTFTADGIDNTKVAQSAMIFDQGLKQTIKQFKTALDALPAFKPMGRILDSIRHETRGTTVTISASVEDHRDLLRVSSIAPFVIGMARAVAPPGKIRGKPAKTRRVKTDKVKTDKSARKTGTKASKTLAPRRKIESKVLKTPTLRRETKTKAVRPSLRKTKRRPRRIEFKTLKTPKP